MYRADIRSLSSGAITASFVIIAVALGVTARASACDVIEYTGQPLTPASSNDVVILKEFLRNNGLEGARLLVKPATEKDGDWRIDLKEGRYGGLSITERDVDQSIDYFLTPVLEGEVGINFVKGAPGLKIGYHIPPCSFAGALSVYDSKGEFVRDGLPKYWSVDDRLASNYGDSQYLKRLRDAASAVVEIGVLSRYPHGKKHLYDELKFCTGFLVSPMVVLTNRHCALFRKDGKTSNQNDHASLRVWSRNTRVCGRAGEEKKACREAAPVSQVTEILPIDLTLDAAFVRLKAALPGAIPLELNSSERIEDGAALAILGYPGAQFIVSGAPGQISANKLSALGITDADWCRKIPTGDPIRGTLSHKCDTTNGSSGSPVFRRDLSGGVVALHFEGATTDTSYNEAIPIASLIESLKVAAFGLEQSQANAAKWLLKELNLQ